jgi:hypothetical protein
VTGQTLCTTTAPATSPGGSYPIACSLGTLAAANYTFSFVPGTLTVIFSQTIVCNFIGELTVVRGQSVLIPPGCKVIGDVDVYSGGSLDAEGAIVAGFVKSINGATLRFCSSTVFSLLDASGDGTSSCLRDTIVGLVIVAGNTAGVSLQKAGMLAGVSINSNGGGVTMKNCQVIAVVSVQKNTGGTTVTSNTILGSLTVTQNAAPVVDRPNTVIGFLTTPIGDRAGPGLAPGPGPISCPLCYALGMVSWGGGATRRHGR